MRELISTEKKKAQAGKGSSNFPRKSLHARKKPPLSPDLCPHFHSSFLGMIVKVYGTYDDVTQRQQSHFFLTGSCFQVDVWGHPSKGAFDVMVDPKQLGDVIKFIRDREASFNVKVPDVQRCVLKFASLFCCQVLFVVFLFCLGELSRLRFRKD